MGSGFSHGFAGRLDGAKIFESAQATNRGRSGLNEKDHPSTGRGWRHDNGRSLINSNGKEYCGRSREKPWRVCPNWFPRLKNPFESHGFWEKGRGSSRTTARHYREIFIRDRVRPGIIFREGKDVPDLGASRFPRALLTNGRTAVAPAAASRPREWNPKTAFREQALWSALPPNPGNGPPFSKIYPRLNDPG